MDQLSTISNWMTNNAQGVETVIFYLLATMVIPFAYGVIFDRAVIRSGFLLIGVFGMISALFLLLQAQFLAMAQIMIYAVGITLVVVIALMLTNPRLEDEMSPGVNKHSLSTFTVSVLIFLVIYMAVRSENWPIKPGQVQDASNIVAIGKALMLDYALPFEFASVLLLAALIGAVMLAKADRQVESLEYSDALDSGSESASESAEAYTTSR